MGWRVDFFHKNLLILFVCAGGLLVLAFFADHLIVGVPEHDDISLDSSLSELAAPSLTGFATYSGFADPLFSITSNQVSAADAIVYKAAYYSVNGAAWVPFTLTGNAYGASGDWLIDGSKSLPSFAVGEHYIIVYSCSLEGNSWDCHGGWQLLVANTLNSVMITTSTFELVNPPSESFDGNVTDNSRWSANGIQWIQYDFATPKLLDAVQVLFYNSATRTENYSVDIFDGSAWQNVFTGISTLTANYQTIPFVSKTVVAVRITGRGNSESAWNSIIETRFLYNGAVVLGETATPISGAGTTCTGLASESCVIVNGVGSRTRTCTAGVWGAPYGTCTVVSCNEGYAQSSNNCILKTTSTGFNTSVTTHPRIWFKPEDILVLREKWSNAVTLTATNKVLYYTRKDTLSYIKSSDVHAKACSNAFVYLATGNITHAMTAIATAESIIASNDVDYGRFCGYADPVALVFDWCYDELTPTQKTNFISAMNTRLVPARNHMIEYFLYHERFKERNSYISLAVAVLNEPNGINDVVTARTWMFRYVQMMDEVAKDGATASYIYQYKYQPFAIFMWDKATGDNLSEQSGFLHHMVDYLIYKLVKNGYEITYSEGDLAAWFDSGVLSEMENSDAGTGYILAGKYNDPVAQWYGNQVWDGKKNNMLYSVKYDMPWMSFVFYNASLQAVSPTSADYTTAKYFRGTDWVNLRSGFNYGEIGVPDDFTMWIYSGGDTSHSRESQGHFELWRGMDDLVIRGGNYMGTPSYWVNYFGESFARNTMGFVPAGSATPDKDGGQSESKYTSALDWQYYPYNSQYTHNGSGWHVARFRGNISFFNDETQYTITTANIGQSYAQVNFYKRDFIYIKPDVIVINDRFDTIAVKNIGTLRWYLHTRNKPLFNGVETIIQGDSTAGILSLTAQNGFNVVRGNSKLELKLLSPSSANIHAQGGGNWAYFMDNIQYLPQHCQCWIINGGGTSPDCTGTLDYTSKHYVNRVAYLNNQWSTWFEIPKTSSDGQIVVGMWTTGNAITTGAPAYGVIQTVSGGKHLQVKYNGQTYMLFLPATSSGIPTVSVS